MQVADLVTGKGFEFRNYGVGIIIHSSRACGVLKVYWPKEAVWCYTGTGGVKPL